MISSNQPTYHDPRQLISFTNPGSACTRSAEKAAINSSKLLSQNLRLIGGCTECEEVPSLGHLPNLRLVHLEGMHKLKCVGAEFYGTKRKETGVALFPALKSSTID
ncbi:unnamed protein product [Prunus brigantina]